MKEPERKRHYLVFKDQLCDLLGITGDVTEMWTEHPSDYLHILVLDSTAPLVSRGGYPETQTINTINSGTCESCEEHASLQNVTFHVCASCAPSTTLDPEPAIIPVHSDLSSSGAA